MSKKPHVRSYGKQLVDDDASTMKVGGTYLGVDSGATEELADDTYSWQKAVVGDSTPENTGNEISGGIITYGVQTDKCSDFTLQGIGDLNEDFEFGDEYLVRVEAKSTFNDNGMYLKLEDSQGGQSLGSGEVLKFLTTDLNGDTTDLYDGSADYSKGKVWDSRDYTANTSSKLSGAGCVAGTPTFRLVNIDSSNNTPSTDKISYKNIYVGRGLKSRFHNMRSLESAGSDAKLTCYPKYATEYLKSWSIAFWLKTSGDGSDQTFIFRAPPALSEPYITIYWDNTASRLCFGAGLSGSTFVKLEGDSNTADTTDGSWHHIVCTFRYRTDPTVDYDMFMYFDGSQVGTVDCDSINMNLWTGEPTQIKLPSSKIDMVGFWHSNLSGSAISFLNSNPAWDYRIHNSNGTYDSSHAADLCGFYAMNGNAHDSSVHHSESSRNNGTLNNCQFSTDVNATGL